MNEQETSIIKACQVLQENISSINGYLSLRGYTTELLEQELDKLHACWGQFHERELEMSEPSERDTDSFLDAYTKD